MRHVLDFLLLLAFAAILAGAIAGQLDPPAPRPSPRQDRTMITDSTNDGRFSVRLDIISHKDGSLPDDPSTTHLEVATHLADDTIGAIQVEHWPVSGRRILYLTPIRRDTSAERVLGDVAAELLATRPDLFTRTGPPPGFVRVIWRPEYEGHWLLGSSRPG